MVQSNSRAVKLLLWIIVATIAIMSFTLPVYADDSDPIGFSVEPILPDNQLSADAGYFDLRVEPGAKQKLQLTVENRSSEEKIVEVEAISASTSSHGEVNYTSPGVKDDTLEHPFSEIAKVEDERIAIPAKSEKVVTVDLEVPNTSFDGIILGSVRIADITARLEREKKESESTVGPGESGMEIYNEYQYVIAVKLSATDKEIQPDFELLDIYADTVNYRASIIVPFRNPVAKLVKEAKLSGEIQAKGTNTPLFSVEGKEFEMAPNSVFNFTFMDEAGTGVRGGDYTFNGKIEYEGEVWDFSQDFNIAAEQAEEVNKESINQNVSAFGSANTNTILLIVLIAIIIILVIIVIIVLVKRKNANRWQ